MKNSFFICLVVFLVSVASWSKPTINLKTAAEGYSLTYEVPELRTAIVDTLGNPAAEGYRAAQFTRLSISDYAETNQIGKAELPALTFHLVISDPANIPTFEVLHPVSETITLNHQVYPVQPPYPKCSRIVDRLFVINRDYYNSAGEKNPVAIVSEISAIRGISYVTITVTPFSYNPVAQTLTVLKNFTLQINTPTTTKYTNFQSKEFAKLLRGTMENFDDMVQCSDFREKENYLIITAPEYESDLQEFANFRKARYNVDLFTTGTTGTSSSDIISFIKDRYNNATTKPTCLLLVGDTDKIPKSSSVDLMYASMDGGNAHDIFTGRFSVRSSTELQNMIYKTMFMESNLAQIEKRAVFLGGADAGSGSTAEGTHNYAIGKYFEPNGFECVKLYCNSNSIQESQLTKELNNGVIFAPYSGHGSSSSWAAGDFSFSTSDVKNLTNTTSYPATYSHACNCGSYTSTECIGEAWIRAKGGAVANWSSEKSTSWGPDDKVGRGTFDALAGGEITLVSSSFVAGLMKSSSYFKQYLLFGDPAVEMNPDNLSNFLELVSPNGGEDWEQGRSFDIVWSTNLDDNVKVELIKGSSVQQELAASVPPDKPYTWDVPADFPLGTDYKIRITCTTLDSIKDESEDFFSIEEKSQLALKTPNGGEYIEKETQVEITWEDNLSGNVQLNLVRNDVIYANIVSSIPSNGSYTWDVPEDIKSGTEYKIRVTSADKDWLHDESDDFISIQNPMITEFPYVQDFDKMDTGATRPLSEYWEQLDDDEFDWIVLSGPTPSQQYESTGPTGDHTSGNSNYVYIEASSPNNPNKKAAMITPMFDFTALKKPKLTFWAHMKSDSNTMGDLYVDIWVDGSWDEGAVHLKDDHGAPWFENTLDLTSYQGKKIQIKFRGVTGGGWCGDMGVDDFTIAGEANKEPEFTSTPVTEGKVGDDYTYNVTAKDDDGDALTFGSTTLPGWLTLTDNGNGSAQLKGTPASSDVGDNAVALTVTDGNLANPIEQAFTIKVKNITPIIHEIIDAKEYLTFSPNPAKQCCDKVTFQLTVSDVSNADLRIFDYLGNEVFTTAMQNGIAEWNLTRDRGGKVGNGVYVVSLEVTYTDGTQEQALTKIGVSE